MVRRRSTRFGLLVIFGLLAALLQPAQPSAAQSATPRDGSVMINSAGGGSIEAGPKFTIYGDGTFATMFDGKLVSGGTEMFPTTGWLL